MSNSKWGNITVDQKNIFWNQFALFWLNLPASFSYRFLHCIRHSWLALLPLVNEPVWNPRNLVTYEVLPDHILFLKLWLRLSLWSIQSGPYLRTGPGRQIFRGGILKKLRLTYGMREKKGCPRERNLREIYTENNVGTEFSLYDATGARRSWGYCLLTD